MNEKLTKQEKIDKLVEVLHIIDDVHSHIDTKELTSLCTEAIQHFERLKFVNHLNWASFVVDTWPKWKQNLLGGHHYK